MLPRRGIASLLPLSCNVTVSAASSPPTPTCSTRLTCRPPYHCQMARSPHHIRGLALCNSEIPSSRWSSTVNRWGHHPTGPSMTVTWLTWGEALAREEWEEEWEAWGEEARGHLAVTRVSVWRTPAATVAWRGPLQRTVRWWATTPAQHSFYTSTAITREWGDRGVRGAGQSSSRANQKAQYLPRLRTANQRTWSEEKRKGAGGDTHPRLKTVSCPSWPVSIGLCIALLLSVSRVLSPHSHAQRNINLSCSEARKERRQELISFQFLCDHRSSDCSHCWVGRWHRVETSSPSCWETNTLLAQQPLPGWRLCPREVRRIPFLSLSLFQFLFYFSDRDLCTKWELRIWNIQRTQRNKTLKPKS